MGIPHLSEFRNSLIYDNIIYFLCFVAIPFIMDAEYSFKAAEIFSGLLFISVLDVYLMFSAPGGCFSCYFIAAAFSKSSFFTVIRSSFDGASTEDTLSA